MYTFAFMLTYTFPLIGGFIDKGGLVIPYSILILTNIFYPLQGLWNFAFYVRPGINHVLATTDKSFIGAIREVVFNGKALSIQRNISRRSVTKKNSSHKLSRPNDSRQDQRYNTSTSYCHHCLYKSNIETKRSITEEVLIDVENNHSEPEKVILQESLKASTVQDEHELLEDLGHKSEIQRGQQQRRSSFVNLASVLCETESESFDRISIESSN